MRQGRRCNIIKSEGKIGEWTSSKSLVIVGGFSSLVCKITDWMKTHFRFISFSSSLSLSSLHFHFHFHLEKKKKREISDLYCKQKKWRQCPLWRSISWFFWAINRWAKPASSRVSCTINSTPLTRSFKKSVFS